MSRLSFGIFGQSTQELIAGLAVKVYDENLDQFVASTSPSGGEIQLNDNNDGCFYVDGLDSGLYTIYVGSDQVPQDELTNYVFLNEDALAHLTASAPHSGHATTTALTNHTTASQGAHGASGYILGDEDVDDITINTDQDRHLQVKDLGISSGKLANEAVISSKIATGAVQTSHLEDDAVTGAKVASGTLDETHLGSLEYLHLELPTSEPQANSGNKYKIYWKLGATAVELKAVIPGSSSESSWTRAIIYAFSFATGTTPQADEGGSTA